MKIPKFETESDEANWAYEHRDELAAEFMNQQSPNEERRSSRLEAALLKAIQTKGLAIRPEELSGRSLASVLREKLARQ